MMLNNKKGVAMDTEILVYAIICLIILGVSIGGYFVLEEKGISAVQFVKNLVRFGEG